MCKHRPTRKDNITKLHKAINSATNEVRKCERIFDQKLAQSVKSHCKTLYAYVRNMQTVRDKVGPMEDNAWNIGP